MKQVARFNDMITWHDSMYLEPEEIGVFFVSDGDAFGIASWNGQSWNSTIPAIHWAWTTTPKNSIPGGMTIAMGYTHTQEIEDLLNCIQLCMETLAPHQAEDPDADVTINTVYQCLHDIMQTRSAMAPKIAFEMLGKGAIDETTYNQCLNGMVGAKTVFEAWWKWAASNVPLVAEEEPKLIQAGNGLEN